MSFALTTEQLLDGSKTVTRRTGWRTIKPGARILAVRKAMGLRKGESPQPLAEIEVVSVRRERLGDIDQADVIAEGFPFKTPLDFIRMFCEHMRVTADTEVTRIEFRVVEVLAS
jgi:hypothetical protein